MYLESNLDNPKTLNLSNEVPVAGLKAAGGNILGEFRSSEMALIKLNQWLDPSYDDKVGARTYKGISPTGSSVENSSVG